MGMAPKTRMAVLAALDLHGPMTVTEISAEIPNPITTIRVAVRTARDKKEIYIQSWRRHLTGKRGGTLTPIYTLGNRPDAPKPAPLTTALYSKRYRERHSARIRMKRLVTPNPYMQLIAPCQSAPKKPQSAKA